MRRGTGPGCGPGSWEGWRCWGCAVVLEVAPGVGVGGRSAWGTTQDTGGTGRGSWSLTDRLGRAGVGFRSRVGLGTLSVRPSA